MTRRCIGVTAGVPLALGVWLLWRVSAPQGPSPDRPRPGGRVSVIIPARDEERSLPALLESLAAQTRGADEVVVIDDHSTDGTAAVARAAGATVVTAPPLPPGWVGKTWACHHGAAAARGDVLVFLDADVVVAPEGLAALLAEHERGGGLTSVQPGHHSVALYEQLSAVCNVIAMMGTGAFSGVPRRPPDMAFGPCLAMGRADYELIGGHAAPAVRLQVAEDIAMARAMRAAGRPVQVLAGGDLISFRMYPHGLGQLVDGWTKMIANGARLTWWPLRLAIAIWVAGALVGAGRGLAVVAALARRRASHRTAIDATIYAAWVAEMAWLMGRVGRWRRLTPVAFPLPLGAFVALFARSAVILVLRRPAQWRGRAVPAR